MRFDKNSLKFVNKSDEDDNQDSELVGTAEYVAHETLENKCSGINVDLWALGCILYLFFHGKTPFKDKTNLLIFDNILNKPFNISEV